MKTDTLSARARHALTTPTEVPEKGPRLRTNLDTDLLKLIAIVSMLIDHVGGAFFPEIGPFRWAGRLAFPLFCYCMTVGLLYTRDVRRYLGRLAVFAAVSQPFYVLAFHPRDWMVDRNWMNWNIFFTLFLSLLAMVGFKERKWWLFLGAFFAVSWWNFDYSGIGIELMLVFFLCRNHPRAGALLYGLMYLPCLWGGYWEDPLSLKLGGFAIDWPVFALLAAPLIFIPTRSGLNIPKWFFYAFYPAHLAVIAALRFML